MIVVNLYGGPGSGKSTTRADIFQRLKKNRINCEEVHEFAKKLTWQKRNMSLACQPYLFGKQLHETVTLEGQVDVVITDSPLLLCNIYARKTPTVYPESFYQSMIDISDMMDTMDYFLDRAFEFDGNGRGQDETQADGIANEILTLLNEVGIPYTRLNGDENAGQRIVEDILARLRGV
jgi:hypothetical protein